MSVGDSMPRHSSNIVDSTTDSPLHASSENTSSPTETSEADYPQAGGYSLPSYSPAPLPSDITVSANDSIDSIASASTYGIMLSPPGYNENQTYRNSGNQGVSFILGSLFILFLIIALRFRNNMKYVVSMFRNLVETRMRQNVFNDTVRETSLMVMLNLLWCASAGIIGFCVFYSFNPGLLEWHDRAQGMLIAMAIAVVYVLFLWGGYWSVGSVFSDSTHARIWVKGFSASQALMALPFFGLALLSVCTPWLTLEAAWVSAGVFIICKLIFIWKGYRIFFSQFSSWVLFLCYLCSLEIVPLILCYRSAVLLADFL